MMRFDYYENHRDNMRYDEYLKAGYPIGTGVIESACAIMSSIVRRAASPDS